MKTILMMISPVVLCQGIFLTEAQAVTVQQPASLQGSLPSFDQARNTVNAEQNLFQKAGAKYQARDFKGAIAGCNQITKMNANFAEAYWLRGLAKGKLGNSPGARADKAQFYKLLDRRLSSAAQ